MGRGKMRSCKIVKGELKRGEKSAMSEASREMVNEPGT